MSADYDKEAPQTRDFFATVQNKLHWAITGKTAAEIIYSSADATKLYMGLSRCANINDIFRFVTTLNISTMLFLINSTTCLTSWKHAPDGKILKSDVSIAKNYLSESISTN